MKAIVYSAVAFFIGVATFLWLLVSVGPHHLVEPFRHFSVKYLIFFLFLSAIVVFLSVYRWVFLMNRMGIKFPFWTAFQYYLMGYSLGYIAPMARMAGAPIKAFLLTKHDIPFEKGISVILVDNIVENTFDFLYSSIVVVALVFVFAELRDYSYLVLFAVLLALGLSFAFLYLMKKNARLLSGTAKKLRIFGVPKEFVKKATVVEDTFSEFMNKHLSVLPFLALISLTTWGIALLQYNSALLALNVHVTMIELFLIIIFLVLAPIIPVPASLGILELSQYSIFLFLGIDPLVGIALALLVRFRDVIWVTLGLLSMISYGFNSFREQVWGAMS